MVAAAEDNNTSFKAGDHITLCCNAAGIPYDHHAIVLSVGSCVLGQQQGEQPPSECTSKNKITTLCVADFTADGAANAICGTSGSDSGGLMALSSFGCNSDCDSVEKQHGLRISFITDTHKWQKVHPYTPSDSIEIIRQRVEFLLKHPNYIPKYSLVQSNCECVAVWCKTGQWMTLQAINLLGSTNFGSRIAIAGLSIASMSMIPFAGVMLTAGVVTEVVSGVWGDHIKRSCNEQTQKLNDAFHQSIAISREKGVNNNSPTATSSSISISTSHNIMGNPFSDTRSLRGMVEDYRRADVILANVGKYSTATGMQQQHQSESNDYHTDDG